MAMDPTLSKIKTALAQGQPSMPGYSLTQGRLYYHNKLILLEKSNLIPPILQEYHERPIGRHSGVLKTPGVLKTLKRVVAVLYWKGMKRDIQSYIAACPICQQNKYSTLAPSGLLHPLPIPNQVWENISMDFIKGLPKSRVGTAFWW